MKRIGMKTKKVETPLSMKARAEAQRLIDRLYALQRKYGSLPFPGGASVEQVAAERVTPAELGAKGGKKRAANLTASQRSASAKKAAAARWAK